MMPNGTPFDIQKLDALRGRLRHEAMIQSKAVSQDTALSSDSIASELSVMDMQVVRQMITGESNGVLPSEQLAQIQNTITDTQANVFNLPSAVQLERTPAEHILSKEEGNTAQYIEVDVASVRYKSNKFRYVLDTVFDEIPVNQIDENVTRINTLEDEIQKQKGLIEYLQSMLDAMQQSNTMLSNEKQMAEDALARANQALDDLTSEFAQANDALKEQIEKSAGNTDAAQDALSKLGADIAKALEDLANSVKNKDSNPKPKVLTVNPYAIPKNSTQVLTIDGEGFVSTSVVNIKGIGDVETQYVSSTRLKVAIQKTSSIVATTGKKELTVTNPTPGGGKSNISNFYVRDSNIMNSPSSNVNNTTVPTKQTS